MAIKPAGKRTVVLGRPMVEYLLYDAFLDGRAAGDVNGTYATAPPGVRIVGAPAVRTVVDTGNKISIGGDALNFATGETANDAVWYPTTPRVAGTVLLARVTLTETVNGIPAIGWDSAASGAILDRLQFGASGAIQIVANGGTAFTVGAYTATTYDVAQIMRGTGMHWIIKGGTFTTWTKLWTSALGTGAGFSAVAAANTTAVFTGAKVAVPRLTFVKGPVGSDSFARADGAMGNTDGLAVEESGGGGLPWTAAGGSIVSGKAVITPTATGDVIVNGNMAVDEPAGTAWTRGTGWTITGGVAVKTAGAASQLTQAVLTAGGWYRAVFAIASYVSGNFRAYFGSLNDLGPTQTAVATHTQTGRAGGADGGLRAASTTDGSADNVAFYPLTLATMISSLQSSTVDVMIDATLATNPTGYQGGIIARLDDATTPTSYLHLLQDGANVVLAECVAGTYAANLMSVASAYAAGDCLRLDLSGNAWRAYKIVAAGTATLLGSGVTARTQGSLHGCFATDAAVTFSGFTVYGKTGYSQLDQF